MNTLETNLEKGRSVQLLKYEALKRTNETFSDAGSYLNEITKFGFDWQSVRLIIENGFKKYDRTFKTIEDTENEAKTNPIVLQVFEYHLANVFGEVLRLEKNRKWHEDEKNNKRSSNDGYTQTARLPAWKRFYQNLEYWRHQEFNIGLIVGAVAALSLVALCK